MTKYIVGALAVVAIFYGGMTFESLRIQRAANKQALKESVAIGDIKAGNVKNERETESSIARMRKAIDPANCIGVDMPGSIIAEHGGVYQPTP